MHKMLPFSNNATEPADISFLQAKQLTGSLSRTIFNIANFLFIESRYGGSGHTPGSHPIQSKFHFGLRKLEELEELKR